MSLTVNPDSPIIGHFMKPCAFFLTSHIALLHQNNWWGAVPVFTSMQELQFKSPLLLQPTRDGNISPVCTGAASHVKSCPVQLTRVMSHRWEVEGLLSCRTHTPSPHWEGCWGRPASLPITMWLPREGSLPKPAGPFLTDPRYKTHKQAV